MNAFSGDVSGAVEAYAAYLNAPRGILSSDERALFDEDMARARAAMERAWVGPARERPVDHEHVVNWLGAHGLAGAR